MSLEVQSSENKYNHYREFGFADELLTLVLSYLPFQDLVSCGLTSKRNYEFALKVLVTQETKAIFTRISSVVLKFLQFDPNVKSLSEKDVLAKKQKEQCIMEVFEEQFKVIIENQKVPTNFKEALSEQKKCLSLLVFPKKNQLWKKEVLEALDHFTILYRDLMARGLGSEITAIANNILFDETWADDISSYVNILQSDCNTNNASTKEIYYALIVPDYVKVDVKIGLVSNLIKTKKHWDKAEKIANSVKEIKYRNYLLESIDKEILLSEEEYVEGEIHPLKGDEVLHDLDLYFQAKESIATTKLERAERLVEKLTDGARRSERYKSLICAELARSYFAKGNLDKSQHFCNLIEDMDLKDKVRKETQT